LIPKDSIAAEMFKHSDVEDKMGFSSFKDFQDLLSRGYVPKRIGFPKKVEAGDINRLNTRIRIAREFDSIIIRGLGPETTLGYEAFFRVFLTHSALERFLDVFGYKLELIEAKLAPYAPEEVLSIIEKRDAKRKLYDFIARRLTTKKIAAGFADCYEGRCKNTSYISAAIRHTFAHGHLSAQANGINPRNVHKICSALSSHLISFMDSEFTARIEAGKAKAAREAQLGSGVGTVNASLLG
jgi:hypothetical protein